MTRITDIKKDLRKSASSEKAGFLSRFFKTGPGGYAEGDIFIGVSVPDMRSVAKKYFGLVKDEISILLNSEIHEERLTALFILSDQFKKSSPSEKADIFEFYFNNLKNINNWDLVDLSAPKIAGEYINLNPGCSVRFNDKQNKGIQILHHLAKSQNIWERRIAIISTYPFIKKGELGLTFNISKELLADRQDLIHKAVGWMLRETGKIDRSNLETFLKNNYQEIHRTTLRYAIEKFPAELKSDYLRGINLK